MGPRPLFSVAGIPVAVDFGFLFGAMLLFSWSGGGQRGFVYIVALTIFTLIHELGHAFTAKAFGTQPAVLITFLGGYASYAPTSRMSTRHEIAVSAAGPLTQIAVAVPVSWWAYERFLSDPRDPLNADLLEGIVFAGITIALLNLLPLGPLDGGHIVQRLLRRLVGPAAVRAFLQATIAVSALSLVLYLAGRSGQRPIVEPLFRWDGTFGSLLLVALGRLPALVFGGTLFIPAFAALGAWQELRRLQGSGSHVRIHNEPTRREASHEETVRAVRRAEREAWQGVPAPTFPRGWNPSPWVRAHRALHHGGPAAASAELAHLGDDRRRDWLLDRPDHPEIEPLLPLVPANAADSLAVLEARVHHGTAEDLVAAATTRFIDEQTAEPLYLGAAGLATRGFGDEAMAWLRRAVSVAPDAHRIATQAEYRDLHRRSDFQQLLGEAQRAAGHP